MIVHHLKILPEYYRDVYLGLKKFEIRKNDRNYKEHDVLILNEWNPVNQKQTGRVLVRHVDAVFTDLPGLDKDYCVLQLKNKNYERR